jgi:inner membrane protein
MTPSGYVIGERSLVADRGPMTFQGYPSNVQALRQAEAAGIPAVQRLQWFNRGFMRAQVVDGRLLLSDLRMGLEPDYTFTFAVAHAHDGQWSAITPEQLRPAYEGEQGRARMKQRFAQMWARIWHTPPEQAAPADSGAAGTVR